MTETKPPIWKVILNIVYTFLGGLKQAGVFQRGQGPVLVQRFSTANIAPQPLLGGLKSAVKDRIVTAGLNNIKAKIDTPEERKVILDNIHTPGLPNRYAWLLALLFGLANMILAAISASDMGLLVTDWKSWLNGVVMSVDWSSWFHAAWSTIGAKLYLWIRQDSHNATAVINTQTVIDVSAEVK